MSRIHDALKKAEQERVPLQSGGNAVPQPGPVATAPIWSDVAPEATPQEAAPAVRQVPRPGTTPSEYLRFEDLVARCAHPHWKLDPSMNVFGNAGLDPHATEQFRTLRSRLYQLRNHQQIRRILVTSAVPAEGKTFVTSNLAQAFVRQPDRRVLLVDADLRCARLHVPLGAPMAPGLSEYLRGDAEDVKVIQHGQESNLCMIAGGSEVKDPSELLSNGRLKQLLDRVTPLFDWVILDSPPCLPVADATVLADLCDAVLLVVRAGSTPSEVAQRAFQELQNKNVAGVVLNLVEKSQGYGSYYYQDYGYVAEPKRIQ
jgi:protein-tyrosine kinase